MSPTGDHDPPLPFSRESLENIRKIHESAATLIRNHMEGPLKEIEAAGYKPVEVAFAFVSLAYHALRRHESKSKTTALFKGLSYFAQQRIEKSYEKQAKKKTRPSNLH